MGESVRPAAGRAIAARPLLSVVVPARDEERCLPALLASVAAARSAFSGGSGAVEVIVADNRSTDRTAAIAAAGGCTVVATTATTIGAVRNAGAAAAVGDVLVFVDADMRIHPLTFDAVLEALASGRVVAGATGVRLDRWSVGLAVTYALVVPLVWLTRMDTGAVFCRRGDFVAAGGYDERLPFAEDVRFLLTMRALGRPRGQRLARLRQAKAIASTRKFDQYGEWHYFTLAWRGLRFLLRGRRADAVLTDYWYGPRRHAADDPEER